MKIQKSLFALPAKALFAPTLAIGLLVGSTSTLAVGSSNGFETDTGDWVTSAGITRVPSGGGILGVTSSSGGYHAEIANLHDGYGYPGYGNAGYSKYGGYNSVYQGSFYQSIDVYIDVTWAPAAASYEKSFWIDMTPYHADPNNYGAEHNFRIKALGGSVAVYVDGQASPIATLNSSGWYTFSMTFRKAAVGTDPVITDMNVFDASHALVGTATVFATSPGGPFASSDLRGNGYVWITVWQNGFAADLLAIDNVDTGIICPKVTNVTPTTVAVNTPFTLTANVTSPGSLVASASYAINGLTSGAMSAADGTFDSTTEDIKANISGIANPGVYTAVVSATDSAGNTCSESVMLAVYDPSAGFVTGGGWIDSPTGLASNVFRAVWDQQFIGNTDGWFDNDIAGYEGYGVITALGDDTARVEGWQDPIDGKFYGPFSRFDGYHSTWPGTWLAEIDVYLDPNAWSLGEGFDYSVAASGSDGAHQRDYIFHVTKDTSTGKLLVGGSNNSNFAPREDLENINHYEVTSPGWYTLEHHFYDAGGYLAVDLNLLDSVGNVLFTETRSSASDTIPGEVGGNRYAWFAHVTVDGGIVVDNHQRYEMTYPAGKANFGFVSKYKKGASVPDGSTEFVFQAGGLNFHSNSYQWLVVNQSGQNAQFKGDGQINGTGDYGFMIWATDGAKSASPDTFRIQIWDKDNGDAVVYDNGTDQVIGGGNILVQTGKK